MRASASDVIIAAILASTVPAPASIVSARCLAGLSPLATAAAMPPCAQ